MNKSASTTAMIPTQPDADEPRHFTCDRPTDHSGNCSLCPPYCDREGWHGTEAHRVEDEAAGMPVTHASRIGEGWMPETWRGARVSRPALGSWIVTVRDGDRASGVLEHVVELADGRGELHLLPGEAREVAAALIAGADRLLLANYRR